VAIPDQKNLNRFYYLENFQIVLKWVFERYDDLVSPSEREFFERFFAVPEASRALLVRMAMRKGGLFRTGKLKYEEIGCPRRAALPLIQMGWLEVNPMLTLEQLFGLLTKAEIVQRFRPLLKSASSKTDQLNQLRAHFIGACSYDSWLPQSTECAYQLCIAPLCERLRLMFFGNLRQDWSEFVLANLGIYRYEKVEFSASSRGFQTRRDVDDYLHLHHCRERFEQGEPPEDILALIPAESLHNEWLENRRSKLLFRIARHYEQSAELASAYGIYSRCNHAGSRIRALRVLERCGQFEAAFELTQSLHSARLDDAENQQLCRISGRLRRKLGMEPLPPPSIAALNRLDMILPGSDTATSVEVAACNYLHTPQEPVYYVENTLVNSLFGLLCWDAIFWPLPGAFFHPFHDGPADLHGADFHARRQPQFAACLSRLDTHQYQAIILQRFREKWGLQSPFVCWEGITEDLITLALQCIPATHLKKWFERMLLDIQSNCSGWPDLIRFWPQQQRYQMIEVKGPGDRLQDNQTRWLSYFAAHEMPAAVCYVQWAEQ
jgi:hypothetical protein